MARTRLLRLSAPLVVGTILVSLLASAQGQRGRAMPEPPGDAMQNMPSAPGAQAMMEIMQHMHQSMMALPMTGDGDRDFAAMMREHHRGAVAMARIELQHGMDPDMKEMAKRVVKTQESEIQKLDRWLDRHSPQPVRRE